MSRNEKLENEGNVVDKVTSREGRVSRNLERGVDYRTVAVTSREGRVSRNHHIAF